MTPMRSSASNFEKRTTRSLRHLPGCVKRGVLMRADKRDAGCAPVADASGRGDQSDHAPHFGFGHAAVVFAYSLGATVTHSLLLIVNTSPPAREFSPLGTNFAPR